MSRHCTRQLWNWLLAGSLAVGAAGGSRVPAAASTPLTPQELREGWILLFDGDSLFGWKADKKVNWKAGGGILSATEGEPGLLASTSQFGNYVLKLEFRGEAETNSGVFLRTPPRVDPGEVAEKCYEVNIAADDHPFPTGSIVGRRRAAQSAAREGWRGVEITADGGHVAVALEAKTVVEYTDPKPIARGHIGLQFNRGKIEFRNVKLKPLGLASLSSGKDLSGWKVYPKSQASVTPEGWIHLAGGKGQLESERQFADFTLQLEAMVNGTGLNSGVFFRSIPGEMWNGYESQIHNGYKNGDRAQPADCGTGGIFRRQNARRVVADDKEWFFKTIQADGNHMAVWVNGYQVSDWTDTRPPADNPRKGLRLKAGTIILQGHDPTSNFYFRNVRIAELSPDPGKGGK